MGNRNANQQNEEHNENNEEILIQNDINNPLAKIDAPLVKKIFAVRNPFSIKKTSLVLEKDAGPGNFFYIKFEYDSLTNFNCYINFDVSKNPSKQILSKNLADNNNYIPAYIPSEKFESKKILVKNLPKGVNMEFFEKEAGIDIDYFKSNKSPNIEGKKFDMGIELVPMYENKEISKNEVVFVSLCNFEQEEIDKHPHSLKIETQKLKTYDMWFTVHDIYNSSLDTGECLICCSEFRNTIFLPCNHSCTCNTCAHSLKMRNNPCPICKKPIKDLVILEVSEKVSVNKNYDNIEEKKEEVIDINEGNNNLMENNKIVESEENKKILKDNEQNNIDIDEEEKEKINKENE